MGLDKTHLRRIATVLEAGDLSFTELVALADLNPSTAFRGLTLRGDLSQQDLSGFDFTGSRFAPACNLTDADMFFTRGVTPDMLTTAQRESLARTPNDWFWASCRPPSWADDWGHDKFGPWLTFRVPGTAITQRMRWCPPGTFTMGSPVGDKQAFDNEHPSRTVTFTDGFWIFDTVVTEAFWNAVMDKEPRHRLGPEFPVGDVSWHEARDFMRRLNQMLPGLDLSLPTEAAWEDACRAGTTTRYCFGDHVTKRQVCFDSRQPFPVARLPANPWGLFEMHGNIWEWCLDHYHNQYSGAPSDGTAWIGTRAAGAASRVLRGGAWFYEARLVRSAYRFALDPSSRDDGIGFRCARVQSASEAADAVAPANLPRPAAAERAGPVGGAGVTVTRRPPAFERAVESGSDAFGRYTVIRVPNTQVIQRLRWIEPGTFTIGSPPTEPGRYLDEAPQTPITFADGFWIFDTQVTQALWRAVMRTNPSHFRAPTRPVESVTHTEAQAFIARLNKRIPGLRLSLPSEAEWEYACRAGTTSATYQGDLSDSQPGIDPVLDRIAWYGDNSHQDLDLDNGYPVPGRPVGWDGNGPAGTHPVGLKTPNNAGLYDMLGNVWEWCADTVSEDYQSIPRDGTARIGDLQADRMLRGGSWRCDAPRVRAAGRGWFNPPGGSDDIGFRCVQVQSGREAARRAGGPSQARERRRRGT